VTFVERQLFERYLEKYADVPGFVIPESLATWNCLLTFQRQMGLTAPLMEIGVYYGKSAALLALHLSQDEELFLIDFSAESVRTAAKLLKSIRPEGIHFLEYKSSERMAWNLATSHARLFRWIHVDGDHKGQTVHNDLSLANHLLADDGIICVDDFMSPRYPQLTYVVCTFLEQHRAELQIFLCGLNKAYLVRPNALPAHLGFVREQLGKQLETLGFKNLTIYKTDYPGILNCFGIGPRWADYLYYGLDEDPMKIPI
jgi:predicted O-methyltransferase YrrM